MAFAIFGSTIPPSCLHNGACTLAVNITIAHEV